MSEKFDNYTASALFVVREIKAGLTRDTDEAGTDGFWDLAGNMADQLFPDDDIKKEEWQEELYNTFWAIHEETLKQF